MYVMSNTKVLSTQEHRPAAQINMTHYIDLYVIHVDQKTN